VTRAARITALALACIFAYDVFRAANIAITVDEAFTYLDFVRTPLADATKYYDANNHVLHTIACRAVTGLLGVSEFKLRIPALIGASVYLYFVFRLTRKLFGETWLMLGCALWLAAHPQPLDFQSLARGYGLALGCLLGAITLWAEEKPAWIGVLLGLSVCFNLVFLVPAVAILIVMRQWRPVWQFLAVTLPILWFPLSNARRDNFYFGTNSILESAQSIFEVDFQQTTNRILFPLFAAGVFLMPLAPKGSVVRKLSLVALLSAAALVGAHYAANVVYPAGRTGIYWVPLAVLGLFSAIPARFRTPAAVASLAAIPFFLAACKPDFYEPWRIDAGDRRIAALIRQASPKPSVVASHGLSYPLRFYLGDEAVKRVEDQADGEFWVLLIEHKALVGEKKLNVFYTDPVSGVTVARK